MAAPAPTRVGDTFILAVVAVSREGIAAQMGTPTPPSRFLSDSARQDTAILGGIENTTAPDGVFQVAFGYTLGVPSASGQFFMEMRDPDGDVITIAEAEFDPPGPQTESAWYSGSGRGTTSGGRYGGGGTRRDAPENRPVPYNYVQVATFSGRLPADAVAGTYTGTIFMWQ